MFQQRKVCNLQMKPSLRQSGKSPRNSLSNHCSSRSHCPFGMCPPHISCTWFVMRNQRKSRTSLLDKASRKSSLHPIGIDLSNRSHKKWNLLHAGTGLLDTPNSLPRLVQRPCGIDRPNRANNWLILILSERCQKDTLYSCSPQKRPRQSNTFQLCKVCTRRLPPGQHQFGKFLPSTSSNSRAKPCRHRSERFPQNIRDKPTIRLHPARFGKSQHRTKYIRSNAPFPSRSQKFPVSTRCTGKTRMPPEPIGKSPGSIVRKMQMNWLRI
mmetsp:Transcript_81115/g.217953  ORF Transcript_81115/g.217953 Transcript_81115/m.217953 type:complete len:268 (-) Transcript_81115:206-1009(-)